MSSNRRKTSSAATKTSAPLGISINRETVTDLVDFGFIVDVLRREKWLVVGLIIASLVLAFLHLQRVPPVYTSSAQVLLDTRQERVLNTEQVVSNLTASNYVVAGEVELIRSNLLMGKVVDALDLVNHPAFDPRIPPEPGFPEMIVNGIRSLITRPATEAELMREDDIRARTISKLQAAVTVSQVGISYAIRITARADSPEQAARIANAIAEQYVQDQLAAKRDATIRATGWLEERVAELSDQLEEADEAVVAFRTALTAELGGDAEATEQLLADLNSRYIATRVERSDAEFRYQMVQVLYETGGYAAVADIVSSPLLETLDRERAELARRQAELARTLGVRHPQMVGMSAQIEDIERSIEAELRRRIEAIRSDMNMAANRVDSLLQAMETIQDRMSRISAAMVTLDQMERSAAAIRETYEATMTRFMETAAQTEYQRADAQIISIARPPSAPSEPRKMVFMAIAGVFGLSFGVAIAFIREALNKSVHSSEALRQLSNLPVISLLPYVSHKRRDRRWLLKEIRDNHQSLFMEGIRTIRARLFDVHTIGRPKVLMVTSSVAGEGKSTVSATLAYSLTRASLSVVLVDADLRRSVSANELGADPEGGCLVDYLEGKIGADKVVQHLPELDIDMVMPLRSVPNAADLIASKGFGTLIRYLSARYDVVIIDTAPVLAVPDALVISSKSDATLMMVQTNRASNTMVKAALQRLDEAGAVVVGTVLSQVRRKDAVSSEIYDYANY